MLLDQEEFHQLSHLSAPDPEILVGLSEAELQALPQSALVPIEQSCLEDLLARNVDAQLPETEQAELDRLLNHIDQLTMLKTQARYTLAPHTDVLKTL